MDVPFFLDLYARPSSDLTSPHPALLNAIYLAACRMLGGRYALFEPYFLETARAELIRALQDADRLTHFLWASVIVAAYLEMSNRITEAYATTSSCAAFALACGIDCVSPGDISRAATQPIVPPPINSEEAHDRLNLAHAIYTMDRSLTVIAGLPSVFSFRLSLRAEPRRRSPSSPREDLTTEVIRRSPVRYFYNTRA